MIDRETLVGEALVDIDVAYKGYCCKASLGPKAKVNVSYMALPKYDCYNSQMGINID